MRPYSAHTIKNLPHRPAISKKKRPVSEARSPAKSSRKMKKANNLETKSVHTVIPDYSSSLEKSTRVLQIYDAKVNNKFKTYVSK